MQRIAREFNYSETTFVLPPEDPAHTRKVRIFTPGAEIPFAGHPNVGAAFVLAAIGAVPMVGEKTEVVFEEGAGPVAVAVRCPDGRTIDCELTAPQPLTWGATPSVEAVAESIGLRPDVVVTRTHPPQVASAGLPFLCVELRDRPALADARARPEAHGALMQASGAEGILIYTRDTGEAGLDLRARMYAPLHGVPEDPATGSANVALAGLLAARARGGRSICLAHRARRRDGPTQPARGHGDQAGRPSRDHAHRRPFDPGLRGLDRGWRRSPPKPKRWRGAASG